MERILKLLLVEDNEEDAMIILRLLDRSRITTIHKIVSRRDEFEKQLVTFVPDFIISDHQLPQFSSTEALRLSRERYPFIPFILVTGTVSEEFAASIIKAGADDYLLKNNLNRLPTAVLQSIEKKKTEQQLKNAHERLLFHIDNAPLGFIECDSMGYIKAWSTRAMEIFGWSYAEIIQRQSNGLGFVHEQDMGRVTVINQQLRTGEIVRNHLQYRNYTKDGRVIWCEWFNSVLKDNSGKVITIMSLVQDITERKRTEESLDLVINRFQQAQHVAHLGHWEVSLLTMSMKWSDETYRIFGLEPNSVTPSEELFISFVHPEDRDMVRATLDSSRLSQKSYTHYYRINPRQGGMCTVFAAGHYEFDKSGQATDRYGILLDVTELSNKEKKLEEVNRELETFIYKTYHDLRSPIVSILGIVNLAKREIHDEKALHYFSIIDEVTLKQNKMLLNLVKVMTMRDRQLVVEPVELKALVNETLQGLQTMEAFGKMKFNFSEDQSVPVLTDRELLFNMLFNLIENSILYRDPDQPDSEVSIHISNSDPDEIRLDIVDNGIGMAPGVADKVFDMFYRGTNLSKGSGLGLYLVKNAVEKLNGTITLTSQQNKGSTFVIRFPTTKNSLPETKDQMLSQ